MPRLHVVALTLLVAGGLNQAAEISASALLDSAIAYHDPAGAWERGTFELRLKETRPGGPTRHTTLLVDNATGRFEYTARRGETLIEGQTNGQDCSFQLNGSSEVSDELREEHRLTCERLLWLRDYYVYLWGLPMKLRDPGARLDPAVEETTFMKRPALGLRVTYDPEVGGDTWYFYFDPESHALIGYRFYHDESANDGEYITLEGETMLQGLRLPRARAWYTHGDDRHLGTDTLLP